ncbi:hypothetical protein DPEC_G00252370 [Dallia pectoralis]|uniref:Uncharacterized protein n=1 Tax=Dallia pectoralis TaxID=75939 RepID=A0ACC2FTP7_DALPE|nr:hypothetical protein DPEC_G00252370 [Dallia pectoralis]
MVPISGSVTLSCSVIFNVTPIMSWCREDGDTCVPLKVWSRHTLTWHPTGPGTGVSNLTLHNIVLSDSGQYRCLASQPDYCDPNTTISQPLDLYVTRSGDVAEVCEKEDKKPVCGKDMTGVVTDLARIILFVVATVVVMTLTLRWPLKARGKSNPPEGKVPRCLEELHPNIAPDPDKAYNESVRCYQL